MRLHVQCCWLTGPLSTTGPARAGGLRRWPRAAALAGPHVSCAGTLLPASPDASLGCMLEVPGTPGACGGSWPALMGVGSVLLEQQQTAEAKLLLEKAVYLSVVKLDEQHSQIGQPWPPPGRCQLPAL